MFEITSEEAATRHGITTRHQEMDNGELRFRLLKSDGTAYIRTESSSNGAWQISHYHKIVKETYIVQRGWIAYAELINGVRQINVRYAGELFTTQPHIVHNIYMPANAVIHTVKHGDAATEDRIVDETTKQFDDDTRGLTEEQIITEAAKNKTISETYTAEYRHFDTLIWQLPAWCTAIFLVTAAGSNSIEQAVFLQQSTRLTVEQLAIGVFGLMFLVILALSQALYRFRRHQALLKRYPPTPPWSSAQTYLQLIVTAEAFALFFVLLLLNDVPMRAASWICIALLFLQTLYREFGLRRKRSSNHRTI